MIFEFLGGALYFVRVLWGTYLIGLKNIYLLGSGYVGDILRSMVVID